MPANPFDCCSLSNKLELEEASLDNRLAVSMTMFLKRIHSHICSVAYPVLEGTGELQPSRLKQNEAGGLQEDRDNLLQTHPPRF
jgi:hypothetical protein